MSAENGQNLNQNQNKIQGKTEKKHILIVEDDSAISKVESDYLCANGFLCETAPDGDTALKKFLSAKYDLVLLDLMLPGTDGLKVLETIRSTPAYSKLPVILVTAKTGEIDAVKGLDSGADDYITKPFGVMELISRVKALLRRIDRVKKEDLNYGTIRIDVSRHTVQVDGNEVELTYKEYEILKYLMKNRGIVLTRDSLMEKIWGYDFEHGNRTVDVHIQSLRKKLGSAGDAIKTIRNVGYKIGD